MNELEEYFRKLRFDKNFHLGLGDVRLTMAMQEEVIAIAKRVASQQSVERTYLPAAVIREWNTPEEDEAWANL